MSELINHLLSSRPHYTPFVVESYGGCVLWTGPVNSNGYALPPREHDGSQRWINIHKEAYLAAFGISSVPLGMHLDHLCRRRLCIEPSHLEVVTPAVNNSRRPAK